MQGTVVYQEHFHIKFWMLGLRLAVHNAEIGKQREREMEAVNRAEDASYLHIDLCLAAIFSVCLPVPFMCTVWWI